MTHLLTDKRITELFRWGIFLKGAHAIIEIIGGILLFLVPLDVITRFTVWITQDELLDDSNDFIANYVLGLGAHLSISTTVFGGLYLLSHGVVKAGLVIALLKNKLWAYPLSLVVLGLFIAYQLFRFTHTHSPALIALTIFDLAVIWLIWREYQIVKKSREGAFENQER
jgi:uncharacterized membrane protein